MKVIYTHKAIHDLSRLREFIAKDKPRAAVETAQKIREAVNRLSKFPLLGKEVRNDEAVGLRDLITGKYIIRYVALQNEIHILRIWHGGENLR